MENQKNDSDSSGSREISKFGGVVASKSTSPPVDCERAAEELRLDRKFGRDVFGTIIPERYFKNYPEDTQA